MPPSHPFLIGHINVKRLTCPSHFAQLETHCSFYPFDAIAITETFLSPEQSDSHLQLPEYHMLRHDRVGKQGGGIALYVRNNFATKILSTSEPQFDNSPEFLIAEIAYVNVKILVAVVYRRPSGSIPHQFFEILSNIIPSYNNIIVTGDFNCNLLTPAKPETSALQNLISNLSLHIVSTYPTHHLVDRNPPSHTTLDLFIINNPHSILIFE